MNRNEFEEKYRGCDTEWKKDVLALCDWYEARNEDNEDSLAYASAIGPVHGDNTMRDYIERVARKIHERLAGTGFTVSVSPEPGRAYHCMDNPLRTIDFSGLNKDFARITITTGDAPFKVSKRVHHLPLVSIMFDREDSGRTGQVFISRYAPCGLSDLKFDDDLENMTDLSRGQPGNSVSELEAYIDNGLLNDLRAIAVCCVRTKALRDSVRDLLYKLNPHFPKSEVDDGVRISSHMEIEQ